jgi:exopolysaccharide/PEP-CTERM locus tyrosine autokinase
MNIIEKAVEKLLREKEAGTSEGREQVSSPRPQTSYGHQASEEAKAQALKSAEQLSDAQVSSESGPPDSVSEGVIVSDASDVVAPERQEQPTETPVTATQDANSETPEVPAIGPVVSISQLEGKGVLTPGSERTRVGEEYRIIKRPLLTRAFSASSEAQTHRNLIMCTSSVEGEGKTFTSLNLAISIAMELDRTVLLVDADLAKPGLSRLLKIEELPGLTDRLQDETVDLKHLLVRTDVPKLTILPAGRRHHRSTELLSSNTMQRLLDELALRYPDRVVLFDSPPLLATSEAGTLAQQMGQICLVVESGVTPQYLVKEALAHLGDTDNVSLILNKVKPDLFTGTYGYGYGYGYGQTGT